MYSDTIKELSKQLPDVEKNFALFEAVANQNITLVKSLLTAKADPNQLLTEDLIKQERDLETEKILQEVDEMMRITPSQYFRTTMEIKKGETPFLVASTKRYSQVSFEKELNAKCKGHKRAYFYSVPALSDEIIQELLKAKANSNIANAQGMTALIEAASAGNCERVDRLLEAKADFEQADKEERITPLMAASIMGRVPVVQRLLEVGANINQLNLKGNTALIEAASQNLDRADEDSNIYVPSGSYENYKKIIKFLLESKAELLTARKKADKFAHNPEIRKILCETEDTLERPGLPLLEAAKYGKAPLVQTLLAAKADPDFVGRNGTALIEACKMGNSSLEPRQQHGDDDVSAEDLEVQNLEKEETKKGYIAVIKSLLDAKAKPDYKFDYEYEVHYKAIGITRSYFVSTTPFELAFGKGNGEPTILQYLLASKADPNKEIYLRTAAFVGNESIVKLLLEAGASPSQREEREGGKTARELAKKPSVQQILYRAEIKERKTIVTIFFSKALAINRLAASVLAKKVVDYELGEESTVAEEFKNEIKEVIIEDNIFQIEKDPNSILIRCAGKGHTSNLKPQLERLENYLKIELAKQKIKEFQIKHAENILKLENLSSADAEKVLIMLKSAATKYWQPAKVHAGFFNTSPAPLNSNSTPTTDAKDKEEKSSNVNPVAECHLM